VSELHLGRIIKKKFENSKLSIEEFAIAIDRNPKYLYELFRKTDVGTGLLKEIASALKIRLVDFFQDKPDLNLVLEDRQSYGNELKDELINSLKRENQLLRAELDRHKNCDISNKANAG